jgi:hypothetical protein
MTVIRAAHYAETEKKLMANPIVKKLAEELPESVLKEAHVNGEPTFNFMMAANTEFHRRGGTENGHIGAVAAAILALRGITEVK